MILIIVLNLAQSLSSSSCFPSLFRFLYSSAQVLFRCLAILAHLLTGSWGIKRWLDTLSPWVWFVHLRLIWLGCFLGKLQMSGSLGLRFWMHQISSRRISQPRDWRRRSGSRYSWKRDGKGGLGGGFLSIKPACVHFSPCAWHPPLQKPRFTSCPEEWAFRMREGTWWSGVDWRTGLGSACPNSSLDGFLINLQTELHLPYVQRRLLPPIHEISEGAGV